MVDLKIPPFKGKMQILQTSHPYSYDDDNSNAALSDDSVLLGNMDD
jgi:hypothetical protein